MTDLKTISPAEGRSAPSFLFGAEFIELIGKRPKAKNWTTDRSVRFDIAEALDRLAEGRNVGVVLGEPDLVLDVDPRNYRDGVDSLEKLKTDLQDDFGRYPAVRTGSGGWHIYMRLPDDAGRLKGDLGRDGYPGIELKFVGRQVVAPGSLHSETGQRYVVKRDLDPLEDDLGIPLAPPSLLQMAVRSASASMDAPPGSKSPEWLEGALSHLPVENYRGDHTKWLDLMMACHHATGGAGGAEFVAWSASDSHYAGQSHVIGRRWDSLSASRVGGITIRTLEHHLVEAGVADLVQPDIDEALDDFADVMDDLPENVSEDRAKETILDKVNADRFTVLTGGRYLVGRERTDPRTGEFTVEWYSPDAVKQHMNVKSVEMPDGKRVPLGTWWISHPQRRQYDGVLFDPTPSADHANWYNLWRGWAVEPIEGDWSKMQRLIKDVLCQGDQTSYDYVIRWMAHMVQCPSRPAEVALVFKGPKGVGKGTLCRALDDLAGKHGMHVTSPDHFTGRFNEHLADKVLLFVDEGFWAGDKKAEGTLKGLITEKTLAFEGKGKPVVQGPNQLHVVMASNEDWVIPASADERRFAVFETDPDAARAFPHFGALIDESSPERALILSAMLYDLLHMDLGDWHPCKDIPQTEALLDQKMEGLVKTDPVAAWWYECLRAGELDEMHYPSWPDDCVWPGAWLAGPEAKRLIIQSARDSDKRLAGLTDKRLVKYLVSVGVDYGEKVRNNENKRCWAIPSLDDARRAFEQKMRGKFDWPE